MLHDYFETFVHRVKTETESEVSGTVETWADGSSFLAGIVHENSAEMQIAYHSGLKRQYTLVLPDNVTLNKNDRVKRSSDGLELRITSNSLDMLTPAIATLAYSQVTAEVIDE